MTSILNVYCSIAFFIKADITGNWLSENNDMRNIYFKKGKYHAKNVGKYFCKFLNEIKEEIILNDMVFNKNNGEFISGTYLYNNEKVPCCVEKVSNNVLRITLENKKEIHWQKV